MDALFDDGGRYANNIVGNTNNGNYPKIGAISGFARGSWVNISYIMQINSNLNPAKTINVDNVIETDA